MNRPNILFVFTDQQTAGAMSATGNRWLSTPNMDAIANGGVRFERSYCAAPVCGPSRAAMMTGRMPHQVGVDVNDQPFDASIPTIGTALRSAGYHTAYAGKWHLPASFVWENAQNFHGFEFLPFPRPPRGNLGAVTDPPTVDQAVEFLRRPHDKPFCLIVSLHNPHDICHDLFDRSIVPMSGDDAPLLPANFERDPDEPEFITDCRKRTYYGNEANRTAGWTPEHWRGYLHRYYRLVEQVDAQIGRLLAAIRDTGLERDTLVVFTSDHGEGVGGHQWVVKLMLYEEEVRVPLAIRWPGVIPAGVVDRAHLASGVDLLPTLCDYAGAQVPAGVAGRSLRPVIERLDEPGSPFVISELSPEPKDLPRRGRMVRTKRHKYIAFSYGRNPELLYDLESDPGERHNLAHRPQAADVLREHRAILARWIADTADPFTPPAV